MYVDEELLFLIARVACSCEILVKNRLEPARPPGRPRAKPHREISISAPFFEVQKITQLQMFIESFLPNIFRPEKVQTLF